MNFKEINYFMNLALEMAQKAYAQDEVPIGAVVVDQYGKILSKAHNLKEATHDPSGHAEVLAIKEACSLVKNWRLEECSLFVTLEPCPMCLSLIQQTRFKQVFFSAYDAKGGALSLSYRLHQDSRLNHKFNICGGIDHYRSSRLLSQFFKEKRSFYSK